MRFVPFVFSRESASARVRGLFPRSRGARLSLLRFRGRGSRKRERETRRGTRRGVVVPTVLVVAAAARVLRLGVTLPDATTTTATTRFIHETHPRTPRDAREREKVPSRTRARAENARARGENYEGGCAGRRAWSSWACAAWSCAPWPCEPWSWPSSFAGLAPCEHPWPCECPCECPPCECPPSTRSRMMLFSKPKLCVGVGVARTFF